MGIFRYTSVIVLLAAALSGCGTGDSDTADSIVDRDTLTIGVTANLPGVGVELDKGNYAGFDVDVASYIADELGVDSDGISFVSASEKNGEELLESGKADMVLASYSITQQRAQRLELAGPYYLAHTDLVVAADDESITSVRDLQNQRLCAPPESLSRDRIVKTLGIEVREMEESDELDCLAAVRAGSADALAGDDLTLAALMEYTTGGVRLLNAPFTDERWGVALRKHDVSGCEAVNRAISQMYIDGTAEDYLEHWFGSSNLRLHPDVPQFEGCG